ncbi:sugar kinase (plasmid) [Cupriavidus necator]|jgi:NAD kinase|uniref:Sugar kinase n=1 Tax=Cupriavidus necator TaxID=106590 RepID=A0A367PDZ7_CUPNE|nr:sugar kinase [Cupriavidus necator]QQX89042.1 sugar kinase [Cupriavidus necator]RCJ05305.1 sugar kinase [Cupriavidus necator]
MKADCRKVVLVTRRTRLEELMAQHHTLAQAKFYLQHLGADFSDYLTENAAYVRSLEITVRTLEVWGRYQLVDRRYLPNFIFAPDDIVVALGQDGLVANSMKYLDGQPLIGLNPEPNRWEGVLLPFEPKDLGTLLPEVARNHRPVRAVTMAQARLSDGQMLRAVNDLFIGPRTHTSALYEIELGKQRESQSSSGIIVSTGLGSTAWLKSIVTGSLGVARAMRAVTNDVTYKPRPWDSPQLTFTVREPFPSRASSAELVYGSVCARQPLKVRSRMPENGVIFSDGIEADYLRFTAGMEATITVAESQGRLVV